MKSAAPASIPAELVMIKRTVCVFLVLGVCGCGEPETTDLDDEVSKAVEEFENRKKYTTLDEDTLKAIEDEDLEQAVMDYIYHKTGDNYEDSYRIVTGLSEGFQAVYTTWWVEAEVNNGGFNQYFWNSSGQFGLEAIEGFKVIGAPKTAKLMEEAVTIAVEEFPEMKRFREEGTIEAFSESYEHTNLNDLDLAFYEYDEDLSALRIK